MYDSPSHQTIFECEVLSSGTGGRVLLNKQAAKDFWGLDTKQQARFLAIMDLWANDQRLNEKQINHNEGRTKGGIDRLLQAFKIRKVRCYGFVCPLGGVKSFVVIDIDTAKKQIRGAKRILDRAKARVNSFEKKYGAYYE